MSLDLDQLERFYDGRIPPALRSAALDNMARRAPRPKTTAETRLVNIKRRRAIVLPCMTAALCELLDWPGAVTEEDLIRRGFTRAEIAAYGSSANELAVIAL